MAAEPLGLVFARRLREIRTARGMTQQALADRLAELGRPNLSRAVLAKIEGNVRGRARTVSLEDVAAIAAALGMSPLNMVSPASLHEPVEILPGLERPGGVVRQWMRGYWPLLESDETREGLEWFFSAIPDEEYAELARRQAELARDDAAAATVAFLGGSDRRA